VACSGDSRAVLGTISGGKARRRRPLTEPQLHKPDHPEEMARIHARIIAAGGPVSPSGDNNRPARVWANGRVGLAMSRSLAATDSASVVALSLTWRQASALPPSLPPAHPPSLLPALAHPPALPLVTCCR